MKLVFAIKSLNVQGGGAERVLVDVANGLSERGHQLIVLTFDEAGQSFYPLRNAVARVNLSVGPPGQPTPRARLFKAMPRMRRIIREISPDLTVGFMHSMYVPLGAALLWAGIPVVASEHIGIAHFKSRPAQRFMVNLIDRMFLAKTVPSESIRDEYSQQKREDIFVLPNPLDISAFALSTDRKARPTDTILTVGRFMAQKNHAELLQAFARVAVDYPSWKLRLVGDGDLRKEIEAQVISLGLSDRVVLVGTVKDMAVEYATASIVAVPSTYESFGLVAAEALAAGRPVLGFSECPGINSLVVDGQNGLLVSRMGDAVSNLASGMRALMEDEPLRLRLGASGPQTVHQFAIETVVDQWELFFRNCLRGNERGSGAQ